MRDISDKESEILVQAIRMWGENAQAEMAIEECLELALSIRHLQRGKVDVSDVASEIADVEIMIHQIRIMLGIGDEELNSIKEYKLNRLKERLNSLP